MASGKYQRYLASREWALLREAVRERSGNRCEHCFIRPQQAVHHLTYERIFKEEIADLMAICDDCHEWLSGMRPYNPLNEWAVVADRHPRRETHLIIPFKSGMAPAPFEVAHQEVDCLWCRYVFPAWGQYLNYWFEGKIT